MAKMYSCAALRVERANEGGALDADEYGQHAELARCTFDSVDSRPNTFDGGHLVMTGGRPSTPPMLPLYTRRSDLMDRDNDDAWSCDDDDAPRQRAAAVLEAEDEDEDDGDEEVEDDDGDDELAAFEALAEEDLAAAAFEAIQSRVKAAVSHLSLAIRKLAFLMPDVRDFLLLGSISKTWRECLPAVRRLDLRDTFDHEGNRRLPEPFSDDGLGADDLTLYFATKAAHGISIKSGRRNYDVKYRLGDTLGDHHILHTTPSWIAAQVVSISIEPSIERLEQFQLPNKHALLNHCRHFTSLRAVDVVHNARGQAAEPESPLQLLEPCLKMMLLNTAPTLRVLDLRALIRFNTDDFLQILPHITHLETLNLNLIGFNAGMIGTPDGNREAEIQTQIAAHCPNLKEPATVRQYKPPMFGADFFNAVETALQEEASDDDVRRDEEEDSGESDAMERREHP